MAKIKPSPVVKIKLTLVQKKVVAYLHYSKSAAILYSRYMDDYRLSFLGNRAPIGIEYVTAQSLINKGVITLARDTPTHLIYKLASDLQVKE